MTHSYRTYFLLAMSTLALVSCGPKKAEKAEETTQASSDKHDEELKKDKLIIDEEEVMDVVPG